MERPRIQRLAIVPVPVSDPDEAKAFYADVLGFEVLRDNPMDGDRRWIQLSPADAATSITLVTWFDIMPPGCAQGLVLETGDIDADRAALAARGLASSTVRNAPWGRYATFADPDGNG